MEIKFESCKINSEEINLVVRFVTTFEKLQQEAHGSYDLTGLRERATKVIANKIADEYLIKNKMSLINGLSRTELINAIQLKIAENFSMGGNQCR